MKRLKNKKGTTLIELVIYISLVGVIISAAMAIFFNFQKLNAQHEAITKGFKEINAIDLQLSEDFRSALRMTRDIVDEDIYYNLITPKGKIQYAYIDGNLFRDGNIIGAFDSFDVDDVSDVDIHDYTVLEIKLEKNIELNNLKIKDLKYNKYFSLPITPSREGGVFDVK